MILYPLSAKWRLQKYATEINILDNELCTDSIDQMT